MLGVCLFNDAFSVISRCMAWNEGGDKKCWVREDVQGSGRGLILMYYPSIYLDGLKKNTENLSQDSRSLDWYLNPGHPEYQAGVLKPLDHDIKGMLSVNISSNSIDHLIFVMVKCCVFFKVGTEVKYLDEFRLQRCNEIVSRDGVSSHKWKWNKCDRRNTRRNIGSQSEITSTYR
jgi:hypothetical protein